MVSPPWLANLVSPAALDWLMILLLPCSTAFTILSPLSPVWARPVCTASPDLGDPETSLFIWCLGWYINPVRLKGLIELHKSKNKCCQSVNKSVDGEGRCLGCQHWGPAWDRGRGETGEAPACQHHTSGMHGMCLRHQHQHRGFLKIGCQPSSCTFCTL